MKNLILFLLLIPLGLIPGWGEVGPIKNVTIYLEPGRFGGWPANNGIWSWEDEIVVGFTRGHFKDTGGEGHPIDRNRPSFPQQARSLDGGETWTIEHPSFLDSDGEERPFETLSAPIDFSHPDFALRFRQDRFYYSLDRCKTWQGPFKLPDFGRKGLLARTDYLINGKHDLHAFIATEKDSGGEGWPCSIRTRDGGINWEFLGWIGEQPGQGGYSIMPSTLRLSENALLSIIRRRDLIDGEKKFWIEGHLSPDDGRTWYKLAEPTIETHGNPPHMIWLKDGRIALVYGFREEPYGIRARISADRGVTWGEEIHLRDDGASWDLGYPRTVQRADGKCVTAYYFHDSKQVERYIACTIWDPGKPE